MLFIGRGRVSIYSNMNLFFISVLPKITLLDSAPLVRALPGLSLLCSATGSVPIYTAFMRNSVVLQNTTYTAIMRLYQEGNYSCVATNMFGTDVKKFSVVFTGMKICSKAWTHGSISINICFSTNFERCCNLLNE